MKMELLAMCAAIIKSQNRNITNESALSEAMNLIQMAEKMTAAQK